MFKEVPQRPNYVEIEKRILDFWKRGDIFKRSVERRKGSPKYILYEGPPTVNASPGIHHTLSRTFKDIFPRYKTMVGFYAPRKAGWDTHGLPVELEIEEKLGFRSKAEIEDYGIDKFNEECKRLVLGCIKEWERLTERLGFWIDMDDPYITCDDKYIETCWWIIKNLWDRGLIYKDYRVTPHCPRCGTSLSSHEVALGYKDDVPDPSIYVKFRVKEGSKLCGDKPTFFLAWTTTPWTLPSNVALAVNPDAEYVLAESAGEIFILAGALVGVLDEYRIVGSFTGRELEGERYEPLYEPNHPVEHRVVLADFVSLTEGTGIVHIAPAYGGVDLELGRKENLPLVHSVDLKGIVKERPEVLGKSGEGGDRIPGAGLFVKDADPLIIEDLERRGLILRSGVIRHTYPFCWRCDSPILYYAKDSWYIRTTAFKEELIKGNEEINWYPEHIKRGRFGEWLKGNVDWALSRERYWGTPLPIWRCESCGNFECIGSVSELKGKRGVKGIDGLKELHRPYVDGVSFECEKCGGRMVRVSEVIDCWFDSGAMPFAQWHYPFENKTLLEDGRFPADYICEAIDQTRGWFYSLHAISTLLLKRPSYKNVLCLGHILDEKGEKMSKSKGNVVDPWLIFEKYGADPLRWYFLTSGPPESSRRFSVKEIEKIIRGFLSTLWNVYSFFVMYANIDKFEPEGFREPENELDIWIISELNILIRKVRERMESYDPSGAARLIEGFVDKLSNWYVRRSRRRFWKSERDEDKRSAYMTLYTCLVELSKILAPLLPFISEEIFKNLTGEESVHLADFPEPVFIENEELVHDMNIAIKVCELGRSIRSKEGIKIRQPLSKLFIKTDVEAYRKAIRRLSQVILDELNIKELELVQDMPDVPYEGEEIKVGISKDITPELKMEGLARELVRRIQNMRKKAGLDIVDRIRIYFEGDEELEEVMEKERGYISQETLSVNIEKGIPEGDLFTEVQRIDGKEMRIGIRKVSQ